jgi:uncharacterized protein YbjQ (UPF0145 family)
MVDQQLITASNQLEGYRITKHLGIVRGITVGSRNIVANIGFMLWNRGTGGECVR